MLMTRWLTALQHALRSFECGRKTIAKRRSTMNQNSADYGGGEHLESKILPTLSPLVTATGFVSLSVDGIGTNNSNGSLHVEKPSGATVRGAYLAAATTGLSNYVLDDSDIQIDGVAVAWSNTVGTSIGCSNSWADVTSLVKSKIDSVSAGRVEFTITEGDHSGLIDGTILAVIFDDPNQTTANTVILLFGAQSVGGDTFDVLLSTPVDLMRPDLRLDMSLGISFGFQPSQSGPQSSQIDVNGQRLTSSAGGQDDGENSNGALITVGGLDDSNTNPADSSIADPNGPRFDDELYDLRPFVADGDTRITVTTFNPSGDDNIFFAAFSLSGTTAIVSEMGLGIAAADANKDEGDSGNKAFTFTVTRAGDTSSTTSVAYTVTGSGAHLADADDFGGTFPSGAVTFAAGETSKTITIDVLGDTAIESDEGFTVTLSNPSADATITIAAASGTIRNDDVGRGTGEFSGQKLISTATDSPIDVVAADIDGDGFMDVVSSSYGDGGIVWYQNNGQEEFTRRVISTNTQSAHSVFVADLDSDGDNDVLATSAGENKVIWYENDGTSNFSEHVISTTAERAHDVFAADIDGDGDVDVASASFYDDRVAWYENDGNQQFTSRTVSTNADGALSVVIADIDDDGDKDLLSTSSSDDQIAWYENDGQENFSRRVITVDPDGPNTGVEGFADGAYSAVVADVDGDGDLDVVAACDVVLQAGRQSRIAWFENDGNEQFTPHTVSTSVTSPRAIVATDVDGDGDTDFVIADVNGHQVAWFENDGSQNFAKHVIAHRFSQASPVLSPWSVFVADIDSDGVLDVVSASSGDGKIAWYKQTAEVAPLNTLSIFAENAQFNEGHSGNTAFTFSASRTGDTSDSASVDYAVTGSGEHPADASDFDGAFPSGTITFTAGETSKTITINVSGDRTVEPDEGFTVTLSNPSSGTTIATATANGTILNDDFLLPDFVVDTLDDEDDGDTSAGHFSLREAIVLANANPDSNTITFSESLTADGPVIIMLVLGDLVITEEVTINGPGASLLTVSGNNASRLFTVEDENGSPDKSVTLHGLTLANGRVSSGNDELFSDCGGAILNNETLTISECLITGNDAASGGGGIFNRYGILTVRASTISGNTAVHGGGLYDRRGNVTIHQSRVRDNTASYSGGGLYGGGFNGQGTITISQSTISGNMARIAGAISKTDGMLTITQSTVSGNSASSYFGGISDNDGILAIIQSTISGNSTTGFSGGIHFNGSKSMTITNSIVAGNTAGGIASDITGLNVSTNSKNNLVGDSTTSGGLTHGINGNIVGNLGVGTLSLSAILQTLSVDGVLKPLLANNGGPTETIALVIGSPAINAGDIDSIPFDTSDLDGDTDFTEPAPFDQRGTGFDRVLGEVVDIGAVESAFTAPAVSLSIDELDTPHNEGHSGLNSFTFTVTRTGETTGSATVDYAVTGSGGDPADAVDFGGTFPSGTVTFADGETSKTITINVSGDAAIESDEGFTVTLSNPSVGATIVAASATGTILNDDFAGFSITQPTGVLLVGEDGSTAQFSVRLTAQPTSNVVLTVASSDTTEAAVGPGTLTFTPENWDVAQTVTVTGVDDVVVDGIVGSTVTVSVNAAASDDAFDAVAGQTVSVTTSDDDFFGFRILETDGSTIVSESGSTDMFRVVLAARPTSNVVLNLTRSDTTEAALNKTRLTFTPSSWNVPQTVTVTGLNDGIVDGSQVSSITIRVNASSSENRFDSFPAQTVSVTTTDNDVAGFRVVESSGSTSVNESGTTDTFTVVLTARPLSNVVLSVVSGNTAEATATPATLTFTSSNWNRPQTVTVRGVNDEVIDGDQTSFVTISVDDASSDNAFDDLADQTVTATTVDNDISDFGDAPESYGTNSPNGARHLISPAGPKLGAQWDGEADGQPSADASADGNDEDGVFFAVDLLRRTSQAAASSVFVTASKSAKLDAWIDFNQDGDFDDAGERIAVARSVAAGLSVLSFNVPNTAVLGDTFARFRISTAGVSGPTGSAVDGEVEDYAVRILDGDVDRRLTVNLPTGAPAMTVSTVNGNFEVKAGSALLTRVPTSRVTSLEINGSSGNDKVTLGAMLSDFNGRVTVNGGAGNDSLSGAAAGVRIRLIGDAGNDTLLGGSGDDSLLGESGDDSLKGNGGDDILLGGSGKDKLLGDAGNDALVGDDGNDSLEGGAGNDTLLGLSGNDTLKGGDANDVVMGGVDDDSVNGGAGRDTLTGDGGNDRFDTSGERNELFTFDLDEILDRL